MNYHDRLKQLVAEKKLNDAHESELSKLTSLPEDGDLPNLKGSVSSVSLDIGMNENISYKHESSRTEGDQPVLTGNLDPPYIMDTEERRDKALSMLIDNPDSRLEVYIDELSDHENVILMVAIRNGNSFEMLIARENYDKCKTIDFIERYRY